MKAVILAAGIASRLRPLTDTTPKCLLKIGERCLLERAFDALIQNGFDEFIIVTGYRQQQIVDFLQAHCGWAAGSGKENGRTFAVGTHQHLTRIFIYT